MEIKMFNKIYKRFFKKRYYIEGYPLKIYKDYWEARCDVGWFELTYGQKLKIKKVEEMK